MKRTTLNSGDVKAIEVAATFKIEGDFLYMGVNGDIRVQYVATQNQPARSVGVIDQGHMTVQKFEDAKALWANLSNCGR